MSIIYNVVNIILSIKNIYPDDIINKLIMWYTEIKFSSLILNKFNKNHTQYPNCIIISLSNWKTEVIVGIGNIPNNKLNYINDVKIMSGDKNINMENVNKIYNYCTIKE